MSRPPIDLSTKDVLQIEVFAQLGFRQREIASMLGFSERTFRNKKASDDRVFAAWARGRANPKISIGATTFRNAMTGDQRAVEYFLRTHFPRRMRGEGNSAATDLLRDEPDVHEDLLRRYEELVKSQAVGHESP
jgi:hypothetical protein